MADAAGSPRCRFESFAGTSDGSHFQSDQSVNSVGLHIGLLQDSLKIRPCPITSVLGTPVTMGNSQHASKI
jgi:hypothetical protein